MDSKIRERSYGFEAVKTALRQTKDGIAVTMVVHPNDVPPDLMSDPIGSRYMIGMARLDEQEQIIEPESVKEGRKLSNQAGTSSYKISAAFSVSEEIEQPWMKPR